MPCECPNFKFPFTYTCLETPPHSHTSGATLCRHNEVVRGSSSELLREDDCGCFILGKGGVSIDQVSVGRVCTIVNAAGVLWLKESAVHIGT